MKQLTDYDHYKHLDGVKGTVIELKEKLSIVYTKNILNLKNPRNKHFASPNESECVIFFLGATKERAFKLVYSQIEQANLLDSRSGNNSFNSFSEKEIFKLKICNQKLFMNYKND